jgi:hypothetical protein
MTSRNGSKEEGRPLATGTAHPFSILTTLPATPTEVAVSPVPDWAT